MKEVLALIEKRKQEFAQLPFFKFMQDKSIDPRQRLAWAPCVAPFAIGFGQLNRFDFRKEPTDEPIQKLINRHTYEDDHHWVWFLEDLEKLGLNHLMKFSDAMRFYWGEETYKTRQVCHQIALYTFRSEPIVVVAAIEAIEATGNVALAVTAQVAQELEQITRQKYRYFGEDHFCVETGHTTGTDDIEKLLESIQLTHEQRAKAFEVVEKVFEVFTEATNEMRAYAEKHPIVQPLKAS
ncbi:hypothetical protein SAMD00079811_23540 [Scytonema sp. HK-05]|uniref:hypothetical protein n=1 Tax=Scytonema sp. HK-05 TaxID=1137095 RepID=UPI0009375EA7|nr:hypothetical protein [Scytonema sp. HK-05]OKH60449.1 hypothetical protein NIES2130_03375 [Scytonema sp. HK-05]BAY44752.1 hypothetical protein SAMD00079811_23540 [Scytonema sp. HK-05]